MECITVSEFPVLPLRAGAGQVSAVSSSCKLCVFSKVWASRHDAIRSVSRGLNKVSKDHPVNLNVNGTSVSGGFFLFCHKDEISFFGSGFGLRKGIRKGYPASYPAVTPDQQSFSNTIYQN